MTLDLTRNARTSPIKCAPCCHVYKPIYYGVVAVITPSYGDGITHPWVNVSYNAHNGQLFTILGYSLTSFAIGYVSVSDDGKTRTYIGAVSFDVPTEILDWTPNYSSTPSNYNSNAVGCVLYLKILVTENISIDVYLSYDNVNWEKQNEEILGEYLNFTFEGDFQLIASNPVTYKHVKLRITINTGNAYYLSPDSFFLYTGAGCYDMLYREQVAFVPYSNYSYNVAGNENLCCTENKYMTYFSYGEVYGKIGVSSAAGIAQQSFGSIAISGSTGNLGITGPIVSPSFSWFPKGGFPNVFIVKSDGNLIQQTSALIDFREPVTFVSKPYFYKAQVNFWDMLRNYYATYEFITNAELTITE